MDTVWKIKETYVFSIQSKNAFCLDWESQSTISHYNTELNQQWTKSVALNKVFLALF